MDLAALAVDREEIIPIHPAMGDTGLRVIVCSPMSKEYNSAVARLQPDAANLSIEVFIAEAATIEIKGADNFDNSQESISALLRDDRYYWLPLSIYDHIAKKKGYLQKIAERLKPM